MTLPPVDATPAPDDLRTTVNLVQAGISHLSVAGRILWANPFYCQFLGYSLDELQAMDIADATHPDDVALQSETIRRLCAGELSSASFEKRFLRKDGAHAWGRLTTSVVRDAAGHVRFLVGVTTDIRELKRYEEKLVLYQRQLDDAEVIARSGSWDRDLIGGRLTWSAGAHRLFGLDPASSALTFDLFLSMVHEADRGRLTSALQAALDERRDFEIEYRIIQASGSTRTLHVKVNLFLDSDGRPTRTVGSMQDVTEERERQEATRKSQHSLIHTERLAAIGSLAASMAHEINNPLAYVILNLESLDRPPSGPLHEALAGARRIAAVVKNLKNFAGSQEQPSGPVDIEGTLEAALNMAFTELRHRARIVRAYVAVPKVLGNDVQIAQVLLNIVVNAAHAIEPGRVEDNEVRVNIDRDGDAVVVTVQDTGCGIPPENMARIFEPFFSTKPHNLGTGLGLPIARDILVGLGGDLQVTSVVGRGTCVTVRLPVAEGAGTVAEASESAEVASRSHRVLVVDDERPLRTAVRRILTGCQVVEASSGLEARDILSTDRQFDVILCDMMMPGLSGMGLYGWLAGVDDAAASRVVFVTGGALNADVEGFLARSRNPRLSKPFGVTELRRVVSDAARGARPGE